MPFFILLLFYAFFPAFFWSHNLAIGWLLLALVNVMVWKGARRRLEIMGLLPILSVLMLWSMPALHYWLVEHVPGVMETPMSVPEEAYFRVAIPGVLAICGAFFLPLPVRVKGGRLRARLNYALKEVGDRPWAMWLLAGLSLFGTFGTVYILPAGLQFLGAICRWLFYVLVLVAVFYPQLAGRKYWLAGLAGFLLADVLRTTMFGELINVGAIVFLYAVFLREWDVWKIVVGQLVFGVVLYWLLSFKYEYRKMAGEYMGFGDRVAQFAACAGNTLRHPFSPQITDVVVSRLNQGAIMSMVLRYVPAQQPFVHGETVVTAVKSALLPRVLWPDKPRAGGVENVRRFMGMEHLRYSINLGVVGEAYVNYDTGWGFVLFLIGYVLIFRILQELVIWWSMRWPLLLLLLPSVFFIVSFVEKDVGIVLNHVVKQLGVAGMFFGVSRGVFLFRAL